VSPITECENAICAAWSQSVIGRVLAWLARWEGGNRSLRVWN